MTNGLRKLWRSIGVTLMALVVLAVGRGVIAFTPDIDTQMRPYDIAGQVGKPVDAERFTVTVLSARTAASVVAKGLKHDTEGLWVIVHIRLVAKDKPTSLGYADLIDHAGNVYEATDRIDQAIVGGVTLQPGVPVEGDVAFEVPKNVADQLSARFAFNSIDKRLAAMPRVPINLSNVDTTAEVKL